MVLYRVDCRLDRYTGRYIRIRCFICTYTPTQSILYFVQYQVITDKSTSITIIAPYSHFLLLSKKYPGDFTLIHSSLHIPQIKHSTSAHTFPNCFIEYKGNYFNAVYLISIKLSYLDGFINFTHKPQGVFYSSYTSYSIYVLI